MLALLAIISVSLIIGVILAGIVIYFLVQLAIKWLARAGIVVDGLLLYTFYVVLLIIAIFVVAAAFGIPIPFVQW